MSSQLKLRRGNSISHSAFTGAVGELTINTDTAEAVVHDGETNGGFPLISRKNLSASSGASLVGANAYQNQDDVNLERITVERHGAIGNGIADDTVAIQAAIDAGYKVYFSDDPAVVYRVGKLTLRDGSHLIGEATLKKKDAHNDNVIYALNKTGIVIAVNVDGNKANQTINHSDIWLENCPGAVLGRATVTNGYGDSTSLYGSVCLLNCSQAVATPEFKVTAAKYDGLLIVNGRLQRVFGGTYDSCGYSGVGTVTATDVTMTAVVAENNGVGNTASGITLNGLRNRAIGCTSTGNTGAGINLGHDNVAANASGSEVIGGHYSGNGAAGVNVLGGVTQSQTQIRITGVRSTANTLDGIKTSDYTTNCLIHDNITDANTACGLRIEGSNHKITDNDSYSNGTYGYQTFSAGSTNNQLKNNRVHDNPGNYYDAGTGTVIDGVVKNFTTLVTTAGVVGPVTGSSVTLQANALQKALIGSVHLVAAGSKGAATAGNKQAKVFFGGVELASMLASDAGAWVIEVDIFAESQNAQRYYTRVYNNNTLVSNTAGSLTLDLATALEAKTTYQVFTAAETITQRVFSVRLGN